jgi:hypothetical protein
MEVERERAEARQEALGFRQQLLDTASDAADSLAIATAELDAHRCADWIVDLLLRSAIPTRTMYTKPSHSGAEIAPPVCMCLRPMLPTAWPSPPLSSTLTGMRNKKKNEENKL